MKTIRQMNDTELAAFVATHLHEKGIEVVLSGGACVALYSDHKYVSMDIDLINVRFAKKNKIKSAMEDLGFQEQNRYFIHPDTKWWIEFPPGPLSVGEEPVKQINVLNFDTGSLRVISPTDCVKDRLTWFYHANDQQCLEQAIMVAQLQGVDLNELERWSMAEGRNEQFMKIRPQLA